MKYAIVALLILSGCGFNGDQRFTTNDSIQHVRFGGEAYSYVVVRLEFIDQINQLCRDLYLESEYESEALYKQAVAQCTFDKLATLNIDPGVIEEFENEYCVPGADLSGFTPEQQADILAACAVVGGST